MDNPIINNQEKAEEVSSIRDAEVISQSGVTNSGIVVTESGVESPFQREIAHTITDKYFPPFHVYASANAWWMDVTKVKDLIKAFKNGYSVENAMAYAGISKRQWVYFNDVHPEFCNVRDAVSGLIEMSAIELINQDILENRNVSSAWEYVKRRDRLQGRAIKERGGLNVTVGEGGQAVIQQTNNGNDSDTNDADVDEEKVKDAVSRIVEAVRARTGAKR